MSELERQRVARIAYNYATRECPRARHHRRLRFLAALAATTAGLGAVILVSLT